MCAALSSGTCSPVVEVQQIFDLTCYSVQVHDVRAVPCSLGATRKRRREERYKTKEVYWKKKRRKVESIWFSFSMNIFSDWRPQTKTLKIIKKVMYVMTQWKTGFGKKLLQNNKIREKLFIRVSIKWSTSNGSKLYISSKIWGKNKKTWDIFKKIEVESIINLSNSIIIFRFIFVFYLST